MNREENFTVSDEEQFLDELDDLIFRGLIEFINDDHLTITPKGRAALAAARKETR
jgi:Mn-dependent DtxR family transcriptional regulator